MNAPGAGTSGLAGPWLRMAGRAALASGLIAAVGIAFLTAMFVSFAVGATSHGQLFGRINDVLVLISYLLTAPSVIAFYVLLRPRSAVLSGIVALVGIGAIAAIVVLQSLLIAGLLTFEEQGGPVSVALLVLGGWFVVTGRMATSSGLVPHGVRMGLIAATYVGYPFWAIWIGRRFLGRPASVRSGPLVVAAEE